MTAAATRLGPQHAGDRDTIQSVANTNDDRGYRERRRGSSSASNSMSTKSPAEGGDRPCEYTRSTWLAGSGTRAATSASTIASRPAAWTRGRPALGSGGFVTTGNQANGSLVREIRPRPLDEHDEAIAEADQIEDVHEEPDQPADQAAQPEPPEIGNRRGPANRSQVAEIVIVKRPQRLVLDRAKDVMDGMPPIKIAARRPAIVTRRVRGLAWERRGEIGHPPRPIRRRGAKCRRSRQPWHQPGSVAADETTPVTR